MVSQSNQSIVSSWKIEPRGAKSIELWELAEMIESAGTFERAASVRSAVVMEQIVWPESPAMDD